MDIRAWAEQRVRYSRARRGRNERGAQLGECGLVEAMAFAIGRRLAREAGQASTPGVAAVSGWAPAVAVGAPAAASPAA